MALGLAVYAFLRGESPEGITDSFPALGLEQVFGALAFYMANRETVDQYPGEGRRESETLRRQARRDNPVLCAKLAAARQATHTPRG